MNVWLGRSFLEGIQIDHHHVDRFNTVFRHRGPVRRILAPMQDASVHVGMECFNSPIEHLGKSGEFRNILHANPGIPQKFCSPSGRNELYAHTLELAGKVNQSCLVGDTENGTLDFGHSPPRMLKDKCWNEQLEILSAERGVRGQS